MKCFEFCVMLNKFGVCESTMRKPERIKECPHKKMSLKVKGNIKGDMNEKYKTQMGSCKFR